MADATYLDREICRFSQWQILILLVSINQSPSSSNRPFRKRYVYLYIAHTKTDCTQVWIIAVSWIFNQHSVSHKNVFSSRTGCSHTFCRFESRTVLILASSFTECSVFDRQGNRLNYTRIAGRKITAQLKYSLVTTPSKYLSQVSTWLLMWACDLLNTFG